MSRDGALRLRDILDACPFRPSNAQPRSRGRHFGVTRRAFMRPCALENLLRIVATLHEASPAGRLSTSFQPLLRRAYSEFKTSAPTTAMSPEEWSCYQRRYVFARSPAQNRLELTTPEFAQGGHRCPDRGHRLGACCGTRSGSNGHRTPRNRRERLWRHRAFEGRRGRP